MKAIEYRPSHQGYQGTPRIYSDLTFLKSYVELAKGLLR